MTGKGNEDGNGRSSRIALPVVVGILCSVMGFAFGMYKATNDAVGHFVTREEYSQDQQDLKESIRDLQATISSGFKELRERGR